MRDGVALQIDNLGLGVAHRAAVGVEHLRPLHHDVEGGCFNGSQGAGRSKEREVLAVLAVGVPNGHGLHEFLDGQIRLGGQVLQGICFVAEALGDRVGSLESVGTVVHGGLVAHEPADFGHGKQVPVAAELHMAVARSHGGIHGGAVVELLPIKGAARIPIHIKPASVAGDGDAEVLQGATRAVVFTPA